MSGQCSPGESKKKAGEKAGESANVEKKQIEETPAEIKKVESQNP